MNKIARIILILLGISMAMYPWISNYLYEQSASSQVTAYKEASKNLTEDEYQRLYTEAREYNERLAESHVVLTDPFTGEVNSESQDQAYQSVLRLKNSNVMAYVEIPSISVNLPIYKGTSTAVLEKGVGHLKATSLPVGGIGSHAVLTGHTGLNSAKLFTDLSEVKQGETFYIHVLGRILAYKVNNIQVVLPEDTRDLTIVPNKDYVTLVTCTPYGVNSHRLLVRGERTEFSQESYEDAGKHRHTDSKWQRTYQKALLIGMTVVVILVILRKVMKRWKTTGRG